MFQTLSKSEASKLVTVTVVDELPITKTLRYTGYALFTLYSLNKNLAKAVRTTVNEVKTIAS